MPKKSKQSRDAVQALKRGQEALEAAQKHLRTLEVKRRFRPSMDAKGKRDFDKSLKAAKDADFRERLKVVKSYGLYSPVENTLTPSRKAAINKATRQLDALSNGAVFASTSGMSKKVRKEIERDVKREGGKVTKRGVFLPRSAHEIKARTGKIVYDKDVGSYKIIVQKKTKTGKLIREDRYLKGKQSLENVTDRVQKKIGKLKLAKNQRIRAVLGGANGNVTRRSFRTVKGLLNYLYHYRKDARALATFINQVSIIVTEGPKKQAPISMAMNVAKGKWFDPDLYDWNHLDTEEDDDE